MESSKNPTRFSRGSVKDDEIKQTAFVEITIPKTSELTVEKLSDLLKKFGIEVKVEDVIFHNE